VGGVGCGGAGGVGFWATLARRFGGFGGGVACKRGELDYIGRCNITKMASSLPLCDGVMSRWVGQIGKFACQIVEWGRPLPTKFQGARLHCSECLLKHSRCFFFS